MRTLALLLFAIATAALPAAHAQEPPSRVGRIAHIEGQASLYQDADAGWEKAYVNSPITSENSVWTDSGARAELRVSGMALRMDELTQLDVARLDDAELDAFIARGSVAVRVRHHENNEQVVFHTPNARVRLRVDGSYRIDVDPDRQETRVTVFAGQASIGSAQGRVLAAGRSALIFGIERPEFVEERAKTDAFDRWTLARDERWREGRAPTYVSTYMTGYEDLDANGEWVQEPEYGALWYPSRVASTWAPYRYGHWGYVQPWGWTWVDDAPWGYAPFHYGRWVYVRDRWAWYPGERVARPVWAPAMVAWVGGSNFSVRASSGPSVGWYPLSPWDRYDPWYRASSTYVNRVNVVVRNDRPTREDRRNWHEWTRERGTTVVDRSALIDRRPIAQAAIPVTMDAIRRAPVTRQPETMLPSRNDYLSHRRQQPQPAVPAPTAPAVAQQSAQPGTPASQQPPGRSAIARPDFGRRANMTTPQPASAPPARRPETAQPASMPPGQRPATAQQPVSREERERAVRQQTDQAIRDAQQQGQAQERAQREAAQQQQQQRQAQERAQREAQQTQERAQRDAAQQQQQQRQSQERAQREAAQQQQQQRQAQERAQREAQQAQERAQREAAQQPASAAPGRRPEPAQQPASREERERAVRQQTDQAIREAQGQGQAQQQRQAQERAQREGQQQAQQQQQAQERAAREAQRQKDKEKEKEKDKDKDKEENKGRNKP